MTQNGLKFKIVLLVDNTPALGGLVHPNIQLLFLSPNTTSLIQPLDQGIKAAFPMYLDVNVKIYFRFSGRIQFECYGSMEKI